jgi:hypothetical protein
VESRSTKPEVENQRWRPRHLEKRETHIFRFILEIKKKLKILSLHLGTAIHMNYFEYYTAKPEVENPKWRPLNLENY